MKPSSCFWLALCLIVGLYAYPGDSQAPAPVPDCNTELINLLPCLDYVQGNVSAPPQNCCVGLGSVVAGNPICLCVLFNSSALPIQVNTTRALQLPALCNVATPNPSVCGVSVAPVQAPIASPPVSTPLPSPAPPPAAMVTPPVMAPSTPPTPSLAPSVVPAVAPLVAPVVPPSAPTPVPAAGVPVPSPMAEAPATTPALAPSVLPTGSVSSPPAPPPATTDDNSAASFARASLLWVAIVVSSVLFLQL